MKKPFRLKNLLVTAGFGLAVALHAAGTADAPRVIAIRAGVENAMKFDVTTVTAAPGETIKVTLTNASTLPKAVMGHNWVLLAAGTDAVEFAKVAAAETANEYIPAKLKEKILAHINLLGPKQSGEVIFTVPAEPGEYPFICSFPAHCQVGMKGVLVVKK